MWKRLRGWQGGRRRGKMYRMQGGEGTRSPRMCLSDWSLNNFQWNQHFCHGIVHVRTWCCYPCIVGKNPNTLESGLTNQININIYIPVFIYVYQQHRIKTYSLINTFPHTFFIRNKSWEYMTKFRHFILLLIQCLLCTAWISFKYHIV